MAGQLHLLFSPSAAGTLRATITRLRRSDRVVCFFDDFSFGLVDGGDAERIAWIEQELDVTGWDDVVADSGPVLRATCIEAVDPVVWLSRRETRSYAGFLWWLERRGDAPCSIIDVTDVTRDGLPRTDDTPPALGPGVLSQDAMARLLGSEMRLRPVDRDAYRATWQRLRVENAPFRVVGPDGLLTSAPFTQFDALLLSCARPEWWKAARIVGLALCELWETTLCQTGDLVLFARLCRLAYSGALEWRGDMAEMRTCEFRLPAPPSTGTSPAG